MTETLATPVNPSAASYVAYDPAKATADYRQLVAEDQARLNTLCSLDPWKLSVDFPHKDAYDQRWRFRHHRSERRFWLKLLPEIETDPQRLARWFNCGSNAWVLRDDSDGHLSIKAATCHLRVCPVCRLRYAAAARDRISWAIRNTPDHSWQLITLTLKHSSAPLAQQLGNLRACFRRLRARSTWKNAVHGGFATIEVTWSEKTACWHPHLHVLAHTRFIDWKALRADWTAVTSGSHIIDAQRLHTAAYAVSYITSYLGKPPKLDTLPSDHYAADYYAAIQRSKWLISFGKLPKRPPTPALAKPHRTPLSSLTDAWQAARSGSQYHRDMLASLTYGNSAIAANLTRDVPHPDITASDPLDPLFYPGDT